MSDSNWEAPTPGTAADTAKPHWSKRKAGPLPVWGWIASGMVLVGIIGAFTDQSDNDETSIPITVETDADPVETVAAGDAEEWFGELQEDWEALEDFYDNLSDKTTETADRLLTAIETLRDGDVAAADDDADSGTGETIGQANARESAASYLQYSSFSRSGLIDQLEFEGFSTEDATYGVDAQNADWFAQAVATAERYLDYSSFSRSELIGQLEFEGFTSEQAVHGANAVGL